MQTVSLQVLIVSNVLVTFNDLSAHLQNRNQHEGRNKLYLHTSFFENVDKLNYVLHSIYITCSLGVQEQHFSETSDFPSVANYFGLTKSVLLTMHSFVGNIVDVETFGTVGSSDFIAVLHLLISLSRRQNHDRQTYSKYNEHLHR